MANGKETEAKTIPKGLHANEHEVGGIDLMSVAGLLGISAELAAHILLPTVHQDAPALIAAHAAVVGLHPLVVRKPSDQSVNNSEVLVNDTALLMAIGANEVWQIDFFIMCLVNATSDIKFGFAYPVACNMAWGCVGAGKTLYDKTWGYSAVGDTPNLQLKTDVLPLGLHDTAVAGYRLSLIIMNGINAGNINLQWAQNAAQAVNTIVSQHSCLIAHQLA